MRNLEKILMLVCIAFFVVSCADLDTAPSGGTLTEDQQKEIVEMLPERLSAKVNGMYSKMGEYNPIFSGQDRADDFGYPAISLSNDLNSADMIGPNVGYNWFNLCSDYTDRTKTYANPYMRWALFYAQIALSNDVLASIPEDTENETLLYYKGQALAVRAFDYLNLVQYYQFTYKGNEEKLAVPIITDKMDVSPSSGAPRATVQAVYDQILTDLNDAIELLDGFQRANKGAINQNVAYGLRARANLLMHNWEDAAKDAEKAMTGFPYLSKETVSRPSFYTANASSWMWAILMTPANIKDKYINWPAEISSLTGNGYTTGADCYKLINNLLWSKIPDTDVRKGWWVDENLKSPLIDDLSWPGYPNEPIGTLVIPDVKGEFPPYTNVKFAAYTGEVGNGDNASDFCLMRAEEMLFIQAEAMAMGGNLGGAKNLLQDYVRSHRDLSYTSKATSAEDFQNEVWFQRRVELWGEGFGLSDVMRLKKNVVRFNNRIKTNFSDAYTFNIASTDGWLLLRIPQDETDTNVGIPDELNNNDGQLPKSGDGAGLTDGVTD